MPYEKMKIYFDGSHQHYIGIPHTEKPKRERPKRIEELVTVIEEEKEETGEIEASDTTFAETPEEAEISPENIAVIEEESEVESGEKQVVTPVKTPKKATRKEIFNGFYEESKKLKKRRKITENQWFPVIFLYFPNFSPHFLKQS